MMSVKSQFSLLLVFLTLSIGRSAASRTWLVDGSLPLSGDGRTWATAFKSIQEGILAASDGETVVVARGRYIENLRFKGRNIVLRSTDPFDPDVVANTIIDGSEADSVVTFFGAEDETCVLAGFTIGNGSARNGGGICGGPWERPTHATIHHNVITGNAAEELGGGLFLCDGAIENNIINQNSAETGGGVYGCHGGITNDTITGNTAEHGAGLYGCIGTIANCIVWGNGSGSQVSHCSTPAYCCIRGWGGAGTGNIAQFPHFANAVNGDYRLKSYSPCIDAGDPTSPFAREPEPNGWRVNIGAYGNTSEASSKSPDSDGDGLPDDWELRFFRDLSEEPADDQDGDLISNLEEHHLGSNPTSRGDFWHVNASAPLPGEGESWETAFRSIQEGIETAAEGETVVVAEGVYVENIHFRGKNITVTSTDPHDPAIVANTILDGGEAGSVVSFYGTENETCVLSGFIVRDGVADNGGGIVGNGSRATIRNNVVTGNSAAQGGGGLASCEGTIEDNVIAGNWAKYGGGLVDCDGTIRNNTISGNSAHEGGGGLQGCQGTIQSNVISGNSAHGSEYGGGGLFWCKGTIRNNVITGNSAELAGGGLFWCDGTIENNTIAGNSAYWAAGLHDCVGMILNCIIWGNGGGEELFWCSMPTYSCIQGWTEGGKGNIAFNPHFVDPENGDFHLRSWSPCIDAGDPTSACSNEREPNGGRVNIGAYGNTPEGACKSSDTDADGLPDDWELRWFGEVEDDGSGDPDADRILNITEYRYACDPTVAAETLVENLTKGMWYQTIEAALGESDDGDEIVVYPGVYAENINFGGRNVLLRSTDPWDSAVVARTVIDGDRAGPVVTLSGTEDETCVLSGFTIRNGRAPWGGGISATPGAHRNAQATIQNNVIAGNSARWSGGGLFYCDGAILNNTICGNSASEGGGLYRCDGAIRNNVITGNSADEDGGGLFYCDGIIENNTMCANSAGDYGGALARCDRSIQNCIIWGNTGQFQVHDSAIPAYSCIEYWTGGGVGGGKGNIAFYPHFVDPDNGDFHLRSWSPCIDAGDPSSDFSKEPEPDGGRVNMGAYGNTVEAASKCPDTDSDGLPDDWELRCFGGLQQDGAADPDGDRIRNITEYRYGWDPRAAAETFVENRTSGVGYQTIQAAVWEAHNGDEIVVYQGVYRENISFGGKNVVLKSTDPSDADVVANTVIDGEQPGSVVTFAGTEDKTCVLSGFTIQKGRAVEGGGICGGTRNNHTHATIRNNVVIGNEADDGGGGLAYCDGTIRNNDICGNSAPGLWTCGGGLYYCHGVIDKNAIAGNSARSGGGLYGCNGTVRSNVISGNSADYGGGWVAATARS